MSPDRANKIHHTCIGCDRPIANDVYFCTDCAVLPTDPMGELMRGMGVPSISTLSSADPTADESVTIASQVAPDLRSQSSHQIQRPSGGQTTKTSRASATLSPGAQ